MHPMLGNARNLPDALPIPDIRRPFTRTMMRDRLRALGHNIAHDATRSEMENLMQVRGIGMDDLLSVAPLRGPAPLVYRTTEPAAKPDRIEVKDMNAAQLRAYCKNIDSAFQPPEKANRTVFLMFLYGKGLITEAQAFKGD